MAGLTGFGAANINQHGQQDQMYQQQPSHHQPHPQAHHNWDKQAPYVKVIEQPAENKLRFR